MFGAFRSAARGLLRWRGGAVVAALTLAVGIGTTTGLSALVRTLLADFPGVPDLDRVGRIYAASPSLGVDRSPPALREYDAALTRATSFSAVGAYADEDAMLGSGLSAVPIVAGYASPAFFGALGVPPVAGRVFTAGDLDGAPVVVLGEPLWRRLFPSGDISSAHVAVDGVERTVVGVMPGEFRYPFVGVAADLWLPMTRASQAMPAIVAVYARLRDGVAWPAAQAELAALSRGQGQWEWRAIPIQSDTRRRALAAYAGALGPALLVLLIACVNVACMLLARGVAREKELTVRRALGASRWRIVSLLLIEHALLALVGGALGAALAIAILRVLAAQFAALQPSLAAALAVDLRLLPAALASTVLACLVFGTVPALRLSKGNVAASLNGIPTAHRLEIAGYGARDVIVFTEVAAAVAFIVWTAMLYTLFAQLDAVRLGFPADHVVAMRVPAATVRDVSARVAGVPGVSRTAISSGMLGGGSRERIEADGVAAMTMSRVPIGDRFLDTLGLPIVRGRSFDASELNAHAAVAVLSESAARALAPGGSALGLRLRIAGRGVVEVVGICRNAIDYGALADAGAFAPVDMYVPYEPSATSSEAVVLARVAGDAHATLAAIAAAAQTPPGSRPARPLVLSDDFNVHANARGGVAIMKFLVSFAVLTLLLAATGVFAVLSQSVAQRTREFGIRLAIGATPRRVLGLVLAREAKLIAAAVATGLVFTMLTTRALFVELTRLSAVVPWMWIGALVLSAGVAAAATLLATYVIVRLESAVVLRRP